MDRLKSIIKGKAAQTEMAAKDRIRYIAFENGRMLVIKLLRDKIDGDKFSQMRQFPNFQGPALTQAKDQQMPTIFWNAKITRVYDLAYIQDV